jgi:hypothetical protein
MSEKTTMSTPTTGTPEARSRAELGQEATERSAPPNDLTLLSIQGKTADLVWTKSEYERLARFLHNDNGQTQFVMAMRKDGRGHFFKSRKITVERAISWSWRTITDEVAPDKKTTFVPYSQNSEGLSRWGCLDFDAHDGDHARAQRHAFDAWQFLLNSDLTVIIEATGGGWHLWCIAKEFRSVRDWTLFLRGVAKAIEATVKPGICEVFPDDTGARHGKGVRAPGSWNPSTDSLNLILWENSEVLLSSLIRPIGKPGNPSEVRFTDKKSNDFYRYPEWERSWKRQFAIEQNQSRHQKLLGLVGAVFHKISRKQALVLAEAQYAEATVATRADQAEHAREFAEMWDDLVQRWQCELTTAENGKFARLKIESEKDAFRIIRNFALMAQERNLPDFPVALYNLAQRLDMTPPGAAKLLGRFVEGGILKRTAYAVIHRSATRFAWQVGEPTPCHPFIGNRRSAPP